MNLDAASIAAQYELSAAAEARPFFSTEGVNGPFFRSFASILPFASLETSNRPTVSLHPNDDGTAVRRFLTPITADTLTFLTQAGWPVENVLRIWLDRMNGVPNFASGGPAREMPSDFERFRRACALIQTSQDRDLIATHVEMRIVEMSGPLPRASVTAAAVVEAAKSGFEYQPKDDGKAWVLVKRERRLVLQVNPVGRGSPEMAELACLLNLQPGLARYEIVVAAGVPDPFTNPTVPSLALRVATRSTAQAYFYLANGVEVPTEHLTCGLVRLPKGVDPTEVTRGVFRVHCARGRHGKPPASAYVAVRHRGYWFYIDDRDQESKSTLLLMLELSRLDFRRQQIGAIPALTLPVGR